MNHDSIVMNPRVTQNQTRRVNAALRAVGLKGMEVTREMLLESLRQKQAKDKHELAQKQDS